MKKFFLTLTIAVALAVPASAAFLQEREKPPAKERHGMMGEGMHQGSMMCPMMGMGGGDPTMMGQMMQMRGEMMMKMGEVMMKYGKQMHKEAK